MADYFSGAFGSKKKKAPFSKLAQYKKVLREDDGEQGGKKRALTSRQYARRVGVCLAILLICLQLFRVYLKRNPPRPLSRGLPGEDKEWQVPCGDRLAPHVEGCSPTSCARYVQKGFVSPEEVGSLVELAKFGMKHGGGEGGATILDLPSGALSYGKQFIDVHQILASKKLSLPEGHVRTFKDVTARVRDLIMYRYGLGSLHPTTPRFFSRMDDKPAKTQHDEYWHEHIDARQYPGFEYTALIYLNDHGTEYDGGEFSFVDPSKGEGGGKVLTTLRPEAGMLVAFTSGPENVHKVHKVTSGRRFALTVAFTCDQSKALTGVWVS